MKKIWNLEDIALRSIDVFSKDIAVKQAKQELVKGYINWRLDVLGECVDLSTKERKHLEEGMTEWDAMMTATKDQFDNLKAAIKARVNAKKRLNHAITQILIKT